MIYSYDEVYKSTLEYFNGDDLATQVWISKYAKSELHDNGTTIYFEKTPDDMFHRIASEISRTGMKYNNPLSENDVYELIKDYKYILFAGRPMAGIGVNDAVSISNCFVVGRPGQDSYGTIATIDQEIMQLSKRGGGVGTDLSDYRKAGAKVHNAARTSSGPVEICANRFSNTIREVGQNGRRGALMLSMDITHPSAEEFIDAKMEDGKITGANISVKLYDEWLKSAFGEGVPQDKEKYRLWKKIIHNATTKAEPGVLFWDTILRESPADCYTEDGFKTISTNPCLHPDSLVLMANNTYKKIKDVVPGDLVISYDFANNAQVVSEVIWSGKTKENASLVKYENIICTPDHLVYDPIVGDYKEAQYATSLLDINGNIINNVKFENLEEISDVYDINLDLIHNLFVDNKLVHNCGEIPLAAGDACRLLSLNLYSYVNNPFTENATFDYEKFVNHAKLSIKLMDNMIELENEKIDKIFDKIYSDPEDDDIKATELNLWTNVKRMNNLGRRSGIGFLGLGDMLAALGYKYGTPEATEFVSKIQKLLALGVYNGSCDLVQTDGRPTFGVFDFNKEVNNPFLCRLIGECVNDCDDTLNKLISDNAKDFYKKWPNGRRNIACLTCAPTGSLATQTRTTSGLEPVFMISYRRRRKIDKNSGIKADFIDKTGDAFIEFNVVHHKFIEWYRITNNVSFNDAREYLEKLSVEDLNNVIKNSPYYGATAMDCDWHERINMQAALQKFVDHSLSVTVNLPKGTSEDVVEDVYKTAWKSGCKGCTIYVDGCRDGVLINKDEKKDCGCNKFVESTPPKRPKKLPCQIMRFSNKGLKWIAAVGILEGKPYEIFSGLAEKLAIPANVKEGFIIRNKIPKEIFDEDEGVMKTVQVSRYDVEYIDEHGKSCIVEGISNVFNPEYYNYAKLISGLCRHGMPAQYVSKVVASLDFKDEGINTWKNGIIRALKPFMKDEKTGDKCPKCGAELWRVSGCIQCPDCGWSKCG